MDDIEEQIAVHNLTDNTDGEINGISKFIKENYLEMYATWTKRSENGFFMGNTVVN